MRLVFKSDEFAELNFVREYAEGYAVSEPSQIRETVGEVNYKGIHSKYERIHCPGIIYSRIEGSLQKDLTQILESDFPYLQMHFEVTTTGCLYYPDAVHEIDTIIPGGFHSILFYPALNGQLNYLRKPASYSVEIELSVEFLRRIFNDDLEVLNEFGRNVERSYPAVMGNRSFPITPAMRQILVQINDCPYSGTMKKLFMEAKIVELLLLQINQINGLQDHKKELKKADVDKLNEVKALLLKNIQHPYSIEELSKLAGINRTKLQEGFKDLFGTTVFGYISDVRLEEARRLISDQNSNASIAEIATASGYKNPQHFTVAFKKKYGYLPREIKK